MAITILTDLEDYSPVYNNMTVTVDSTNKLSTSFRYMFDVYITGVAGFARFKIDPEPITAQELGVFDVNRVIEAYVESYILTINPTGFTGGFTPMLGSLAEYQIKYGEEYDVAGTITEFPDLTIGTTKYAYESSLPFDEWVDFNFDDIDLAVNGSWLTSNLNNRIDFDTVGYSGVISSDATIPEYLEIKTFDSAGTLLGTWRAQNLSPVTYQTKMMLVATGTFNLNQITSGLVTGVQPIIIPTVASYTLQILDPTFVAVTPLLNFEIQEQCEYPLQRLMFENKWGAFDGFTFDLVSKESQKITRKKYKFNPTIIDGGGNLDYNHANRTNVDYLIKSTKQISLNADWITEAENDWLLELVESPEIYLQGVTSKGDQTLYSVESIQANSYAMKTKKVDGLFNIDLIITLSSNNYRQRK